MPRLIRSAVLNNFVEVARSVGLDPYRMITEFHLPAACLTDSEIKISAGKVGRLFEAAAERSRQVGDEEMSDDIRWIRSYVLEEGNSAVGTVCVYQASSPEAIRDHASRADLPIDEIIPVADTVLVRPDPEAASA